MSANTLHPARLYLLQVAHLDPTNIPIVCYLIQMSDGRNVLIDTGLPDPLPPPEQLPPGRKPVLGDNVVTQLAQIGVQPADVSLLISTHFDRDHSGLHDAFPNAPSIVQRAHYDDAQANPRFDLNRARWNQPPERFQFVDGDVTLLPGVELIETSGHTLGHMSVLVTLPQTGKVLLAIDAVLQASRFIPAAPDAPQDADSALARASTQKLIDLAEREQVALVIFGHDPEQWAALKKLPDFYD